MTASKKDINILIERLKKFEVSVECVSTKAQDDETTIHVIDRLKINRKTPDEYCKEIEKICDRIMTTMAFESMKKRSIPCTALRAYLGEFVEERDENDLKCRYMARKDMRVSYKEGGSEQEVGKWEIIKFVSKSNYRIQPLIQKLVKEINDRSPVEDSSKGIYSFTFTGFKEEESERRLLSLRNILIEHRRIKDIDYASFIRIFNGSVKQEIKRKIVWLKKPAEFKMFMDALFATGKFKPANRVWQVSEKCFILNDPPPAGWKYVRSWGKPSKCSDCDLYLQKISDNFTNQSAS